MFSQEKIEDEIQPKFVLQVWQRQGLPFLIRYFHLSIYLSYVRSANIAQRESLFLAQSYLRKVSERAPRMQWSMSFSVSLAVFFLCICLCLCLYLGLCICRSFSLCICLCHYLSLCVTLQ